MDDPGSGDDRTLLVVRSIGAVLLSMLLFVSMQACSIMVIGNTPRPDVGQVAANFVSSLVWAIVAGAVAATIAERGRVLHAFLAGLLLSCVALYLVVIDPEYQRDYKVGLAIAIVPGFVAGAFAWARRVRASE